MQYTKLNLKRIKEINITISDITVLVKKNANKLKIRVEKAFLRPQIRIH